MTLSLILAVLALAILYVLYKYVYAPFQVFQRCGVKSPPGHVPIFGHYFQLEKDNILVFEKSLTEKYGPIFGYYLGQRPIFVINDTEMVKDLSVKHVDAFMYSPPRTKLMEGKVPDGILLAEGKDWEFRRKLLTPSFSAARMKLMVPLLEKSLKTLTEVLAEKADGGASVDFLEIFKSFTMETILAIAFGRAIEVQRGESNSLTEAATSIFDLVRGNRRFFLAIFSNFPWLDPLLALFTRPSWAYSTLSSTLLSIITTRRQDQDRGKYKDLLQLIVDASCKGNDTTDPPDPSRKQRTTLTDDEVANVAMDMLLAGFETTANTLTFALYLLATHPEVQEKLQREIMEYYKSNPDVSNFEAISEIKYLDMVVQETLRLYPIAPRPTRVCSRDITINNVHFPKGAYVTFSVHALHFDPKNWKDPEKFDPMRFTAEEKAKRPQLSHAPFGFGRHSCLGMRLALLETKMALLQIFSKFTVLTAPETEIPPPIEVGLTVTPVNGVYLKIVRFSKHNLE